MKQIHFSKAKAWFEQIAYNREQTKHTKSSQSKSYCHPIIVNKNESKKLGQINQNKSKDYTKNRKTIDSLKHKMYTIL